MMRLLSLIALLSACSEYVEVRNTADRIWLREKDGSTVLRCYDATPPGALRGKPRVFCKEAHMYGTATNPDPEPSVVIPPAQPAREARDGD